jgi:hypothetical protein
MFLSKIIELKLKVKLRKKLKKLKNVLETVLIKVSSFQQTEESLAIKLK